MLEEGRVQEQIRHFVHLSLPFYIGKGTAVEARDWLRKITKISGTMVITFDTAQVRLPTFQLDSTADEW